MMKKVLIFGEEQDIHVFAVKKLLKEKYSVNAVIVDTSKLLAESSISTTISNYKETCSIFSKEELIIDSDTSVWWRRIPKIILPVDVTDNRLINFIHREWWSTIEGGIIASNCYCINDIYSEKKADNKSYQLAVAKKLGFKIPETLITSDIVEAEYFFNNNPAGIVFKAQSDAKYHMGETRLVDEFVLSKFDSLKLAPVIFQEFIPCKEDLRITVINEDVFATKIETMLNPKIDWRIDLAVPMFPTEISSEVSNLCIQLLKQLNLIYGAIDLRITPNNEIYFFEINPSGQFLFCEFDSDLRITNSLCKALVDN